MIIIHIKPFRFLCDEGEKCRFWWGRWDLRLNSARGRHPNDVNL